MELAWLQRQTGDIASAERSLREALKAQPQHPVALAQLGEIYQETGQFDRATAMYRRSLQTNWDQSAVHARLASVPRVRNARPTAMGSRTALAQPVYVAPNGYRMGGQFATPTYAPVYAETSPSAGQFTTPGPPPIDGDPAHVPVPQPVPPPQD